MAPTPVSLPGEAHGQGSLVGYSPQVPKELDITERLTLSFSPVATPGPREVGTEAAVHRAVSRAGAELVGAGTDGKGDSRPTLPTSLVVTHLSEAHGGSGSCRWDLVEEEWEESASEKRARPPPWRVLRLQVSPTPTPGSQSPSPEILQPELQLSTTPLPAEPQRLKSWPGKGREGGALLGRRQGQLGVFETETEIEIEAETEEEGGESEGGEDMEPESEGRGGKGVSLKLRVPGQGPSP